MLNLFKNYEINVVYAKWCFVCPPNFFNWNTVYFSSFMENSKKWDFEKYFYWHLYFFNIISTFTSQNKLRDSTSERKKNFLFTSACFNEHHSAVAEKNAVPFPASVPFNPIFVFFSSFSCFTFYWITTKQFYKKN